MVATKRVPLAEVDNGKERKVGITDAGLVFQEPLGGFIFVCNNDTIGEDFERHLFGLPQRYEDSVTSIQPGLPLFLYNYSTRCLHGVFEASSDGGLNIEPDAWGENKDSRKNGRQNISRFPAQVRVRWREERPPLEEEKFRPVLYHYDGPKFRLQLSKSEAQELLELFGASPIRKIEEPQEDTGGEWEKVKTKSKASRTFRATATKGNVSPNSTSGNSGRRRGSNGNGNGNGNGSSSNGGGSLFSSLNSSVHEAVSRGRDGEIKSETTQRWRTDSDSWSGSSSAGTVSSNCGSHDEDRFKKGPRENGCIAEIGEFGDSSNGVAFAEGMNGSIDSDYKSESRAGDDHSIDMNGVGNNSGTSAASNSSSRSGFVSYSAALKSGMLGAAAAENGVADNVVSPPKESAMPMNSNTGSRSSVNSYISAAASASSVSPSSRSTSTKGDLSGDRIESPKQKLDAGWTKARAEGIAGNSARAGPLIGVANGKEDAKSDHLTSRDGEEKKVERLHPWGKPLTGRPNLQEVGSGQITTTFGDFHKPVKISIDSPKKPAKDGLKNILIEGENGDSSSSSGHQRQATNPEVKEKEKENSVNPAEPIVRKNAWQSNDGAVLRLLHDPDPAVNSTSAAGGSTEQRSESEAAKKDGQRPGLQTPEDKARILQSTPSDGRQPQYLKQLSSPSGGLLSHSSHPRADAPVYQHSRSFHEPRRQQYDNQKYEKQHEDRSHFRKQQAHAQEHPHPSNMVHSQQHQVGQGLMPLRVPTPPSPGMQHHHQPLLTPAPQGAMYRDRSRSRAGNGSVDNVHALAYRPVSRNILDGDLALQSQLMPGSWSLQSPVLLMQPVLSPVTGSLTFPTPSPHLLINADALHCEILEFARAATPSAEIRMHAEAAVECVRSSVKQLWPDADVEVFGSFATGLCLHHSDVDVVVVDSPLPIESPGIAAMSGARLLTPMIRALASALKEYEWCDGLNTIETASMPVIKLRCCPQTEEPSPRQSVAIDITIGGKRSATFAGVSQVNVQREAISSKPLNPKFEAARNAHNGAAAREFVIERLRQLPALAPLVLLLKSFLRCRSLNDVYSGGLGSFALTLMLVFYLERVPISCGVPQEGPPQPSKSPAPSEAEASTASTVSVDTTQASGAVAEAVDLSDDDSSDSSVLTSTSVSSMVSTEVASLQGSSCGGDSSAAPLRLSNEEPVLRKAGGIVEELLASMHSVVPPNLGMLLVGFLHFFGQEIDFSRVRLVLKGKNGSAGGVFWHEKNARTLPLCIDDPLRPDAYIGAGSFNIWQVQAAMRDMLSVITRPPPVATNLPADGQRVGNGLTESTDDFPLLHQFLVNDVPL